MAAAGTPPERPGSVGEVFLAFLRLGLTSFGGPVAHLGYYRTEFVQRRRWLDDRAYADLVALCQFLPGPASSQAGMALGLGRAGMAGALAAWVGFTLPSAAIMAALGLGVAGIGPGAGGALGGGLLIGLKAVAVAIVAQALWGMARSLAPDPPRLTLAVAAAALVVAVPGPGGQVGAIVLGGLAGWAFLAGQAQGSDAPLPVRVGRGTAVAALALFAVLLVGLPLAAGEAGRPWLHQADSFYRAGALVFGGGHVVLPLLEAELVGPGWVGRDAFVAGYGAAQAVPGPLFTFAAYLGAVADPGPGGLAGALVCLVAVFLPGFLLVVGALPFWAGLRRAAWAQAVLAGINAAVVGLLLAALYDPVWIVGVVSGTTFLLAVAAGVALVAWRLPPWLVVLATGAAGAALGAAGLG